MSSLPFLSDGMNGGGSADAGEIAGGAISAMEYGRPVLHGGSAGGVRGGALSERAWMWILIGVLVAALIGIGIWLGIVLVERAHEDKSSSALKAAPLKQTTVLPKLLARRNAIAKRGSAAVPAPLPSRVSAMNGSVHSDDVPRAAGQAAVPVSIRGPGGMQLAAGRSGYSAPRNEALQAEIAARAKKLGAPSAAAVASGKFDRSTLRNLKAIHRMGGSMMPIRVEHDGVVDAGTSVGAVEHARAVARYMARDGKPLSAKDGELLEANPRLLAHLEEGKLSEEHRRRLVTIMRSPLSTTDAAAAMKTMSSMLRARDEMLQRGIRVPDFNADQKKALMQLYAGGNVEVAEMVDRVMELFHVVM